MLTSELQYSYPAELIAQKPSKSWRALFCKNGDPVEIPQEEVLDLVQPGDVFVINDTQVLKRRVFTDQGLEILFLNHLGENRWQVLFPARKLKPGDQVELPEAIKMTLVEKGIPQTVEINQSLTEKYFQQHAELALPPYIQQAREARRNQIEDEDWYTTDWGENYGSCAAPTASLHFTNDDLEKLRSKKVEVHGLTLHVGLGTFLPIRTDDLSGHKMHSEWASIPSTTLRAIQQCEAQGKTVWALGTTVTRALESWAHGYLQTHEDGCATGWTDIFIKPGFEFKCVSGLLTNFHQPESTLMALVAAFSGLDNVKRMYAYAVENKFRLFSYGDLSLWKRK